MSSEVVVTFDPDVMPFSVVAEEVSDWSDGWAMLENPEPFDVSETEGFGVEGMDWMHVNTAYVVAIEGSDEDRP